MKTSICKLASVTTLFKMIGCGESKKIVDESILTHDQLVAIVTQAHV